MELLWQKRMNKNILVSHWIQAYLFKKNLGIINAILLPRKTLDKMYKTLVRLDYCDIIYHIP